MIDNKSSLQICAHEAAHATIARLLGVEVIQATADPADPHVRTRFQNTVPMLAKLATIDLAGAAMEEGHGHGEADEANAAARCAQMVGMAFDGDPFEVLQQKSSVLLEELRADAKRLVARHVSEIAIVTAALAERGQLNQAEIDALLLRGHDDD
ncbi:MAG: hypothetical protein ACLP19_05230 [Xanthobacteraceae bacterium]